ncbi:hypothetical protein AAFF_G00336290 [Aldrovandia affinis]|uniref:USP domain-containing protein n=1 Tax=Aldrovandia affinis TaxID=143900 RepID=A0AAD7R8L3_9TELE|nr:hypothetical protein AAFF_G00336290 [Aldrovandia affinis]
MGDLSHHAHADENCDTRRDATGLVFLSKWLPVSLSDATQTKRASDPRTSATALAGWTQDVSGGDPHICYRGLANLGSTCYLNTVLQVLYMTEGFRDAVEREESKEGGVVVQLKSVFAGLKAAKASTLGLTQTLGIQNVFEQQDAAEYFQQIVTSLSPHLSQIFQGSVKNSTVCERGNHDTSPEVCPFIVLPLSIDISPDCHHIYSVENGLKAYFRPSVLDGDNQMYCDFCEEKTDTETRCEMEQYPQVLTLHLMRFEFNYSCMCFVKNDCWVDIPVTLELEKHTYELYAIANHAGNYTAGHYWAVIKSHENHSWYCFDDTFVQKLGSQDTTRSRHAYLLMYMRRELPDYRPDPPPATPETAETHTTPETAETQPLKQLRHTQPLKWLRHTQPLKQLRHTQPLE